LQKKFLQKFHSINSLKQKWPISLKKSAILILAPLARRSAKLFHLPFRVCDESDKEKPPENGV